MVAITMVAPDVRKGAAGNQGEHDASRAEIDIGFKGVNDYPEHHESSEENQHWFG